MCKEVDDSPKEQPKPQPPSIPVQPKPTPKPEAPPPPPPKEEVSKPSEEEKKTVEKVEEKLEEKSEEDKLPLWINPSIPPEIPHPSVYSNTIIGRDPLLLSTSDEQTTSTDISDFPSQTSNSVDHLLDRSPL